MRLASDFKAASTIAWASAWMLAQVLCADEALGVDLVDILRAGWAGGKPAVVRHHFQPADGGVVVRARGSAWR